MSHRASFLFKTYEYNDRIVVEKNLSNKNKCIVIGGYWIIPTLVFHKTKNSVLVFEINSKIIKILKIIYKLIIVIINFLIKTSYLIKFSNFYHNKNFLETSSYITQKIFCKQYLHKKLRIYRHSIH